MGPGLRVLPTLARPRPGPRAPRPAPPQSPRAGRAGSGAERGRNRLPVGEGGRRRRRRQPRLRRREAGQRSQAARRGRHPLLLAVIVTAADVGDRATAQVLLARVAAAHHLLALVWADGGYTGSLVEYSLAVLAVVLVIVKRSDDMRGFVVLPKRWIVERFFAHLMRSRRLVRDFERSTSSAEAMVYWSMRRRTRLGRSRPHHIRLTHNGAAAIGWLGTNAGRWSPTTGSLRVSLHVMAGAFAASGGARPGSPPLLIPCPTCRTALPATSRPLARCRPSTTASPTS
ncbi:transposase [Streptomyces sp. NRRL B-24720]|uniref:transposase n=1 Tax=Streptomyces sp. NRRL B-24720 TaxID=1476876 RepID=UPI001F22BCFB|nr:transposase [Streptomyces sp. NRRL B-24720]